MKFGGNRALREAEPQAGGSIDSVQLLRGAAAVLVVICHGAKEAARGLNPNDASLWWPISNSGRFGVDLFFIISGFIMVYVSADRLEQRGYAFDFMRRRVARVAPVYWFYTLASLGVSIVTPGVKHHDAVDPIYLLKSLFFVPATNPTTGDAEPVLGLGWTLNYEMYFYLVFAVCVAVARRRAFDAIIVFLVLTGLTRLFAPSEIWLPTLGSLVIEFVYGMVIARLFMAKVRMPVPLAIVLSIAGVVGWIVASAGQMRGLGPSQEEFRFLLWGVPAACIVASVVLSTISGHRLRKGLGRLAVAVGDASYSLYLSHLFVMRPLSIVLAKLGLGSEPYYPYLYLPLFTVLAIGASFVSRALLENPSNDLTLWLLGVRKRRGRGDRNISMTPAAVKSAAAGPGPRPSSE